MDNEVNYLMEELKMLSSKSAYLRQRLDGMSAFYLTGLAALVTAAIGLPTLQQVGGEFTTFGIGLVYFGISVISAYVFVRVLHFRVRMIETEIHMNTIRKMVLSQGVITAAYLTAEEPQNDLYITRRSGSLIFGLSIFSSIGLGLALHSFLGRLLLSLEWVVIVLTLFISLTVFAATQIREARKIERLIVMNKAKKFEKAKRRSRSAG